MALKYETKYWYIFEGWYGQLIEVSKNEASDYKQALLLARAKVRCG